MPEQFPIGYTALIERYQLQNTPHYRKSYVTMKGKGSVWVDDGVEIHVYRKEYLIPEFDPFKHLEFALKYDGLNLEIISQLFNHLQTDELVTYINAHPTGRYARIIWFLYEWLTDESLDILDAKAGNYAIVLNEDKYFTKKGFRCKRYRVINNLLGNKAFCPIVRRSQKLIHYIDDDLQKKAQEILDTYDPNLIARAAQYLFSKETISSYAIEREKPDKKREFRYVELLKSADKSKELNKQVLVSLQNATVEPLFANVDYRHTQNYIGEAVNFIHEKVHYIPPKPEDVNDLMSGLLDALKDMVKSEVHPVIIAAVIAFGFVFIHPFDDGNGRLHRFLIHHILARSMFTPRGVIFPVSSVMVKNMYQYDEVLESFSKPISALVDYKMNQDGEMTVKGDTAIYYRYNDYTSFAEYLFDCIEKTIEIDFLEELEFLSHYDATKEAIQAYLDMPDRLIDLLIKFVCQNHGKLANSKREKYFYMLNDEQINTLIDIVTEHMNINVR